MISTLGDIIAKRKHVKNGTYVLEEMELLHQKLHASKSRNSERDLPATASRTGLFTDTFVNAMERRGNLFLLLCMSYTQHISYLLDPILRAYGSTVEEFRECVQLYLSMEEWFHKSNPIDDVKSARPLIGRV